MSVSVEDINKLRQETGAGMMDCKEALQEADGNFDEAIQFLRKKGQKVSAKRAEKEANEGVVMAKTNSDNTKGIIFNINCETDFVAKNEEFVDFAKKVADIAIKKYPDNKSSLLSEQIEDLTIEESINQLMGKIGEKMEFSHYKKLEGETVLSYIHAGNNIGVLVSLNKSGDEAQQVGKDLAMQIAAMNPLAITKEDVDQATIDKEKEVARDQAKEQDKPDHIIEKIVEGKVNKFLNQNTLLNQVYVKDSEKSVKQMMEEADSDLEINDFIRIEVGE